MDTQAIIEHRKALLSKALEPWLQLLAARKTPIQEFCLVEAYPGDRTTSFTLKVKASWIDDLCCSDALDVLLPAMWEAVPQDWREQIFIVDVRNSADEIRCQGTVEEYENAQDALDFVERF